MLGWSVSKLHAEMRQSEVLQNKGSQPNCSISVWQLSGKTSAAHLDWWGCRLD